MNSKEVLVVGELNVDLILNGMNSLPQIGAEIIAEQLTMAMGSSSAIMAANLAALGTSVAFCGKLGDDQFADFILSELNSKGIDTSCVQRIPGYKTGATVVLSYGQERANITYCGAMELLTMNDIPWEALQKYNHLHLSNFFVQKGLKNNVVELFRKAKSLGVTTSLDLQWDPANEWAFDYKACLAYVDIFMPNEAELLALTGRNSIDDALGVIRPYAHTVALKRGKKGSIGISEDERIELSAFQTEKFIDAIGAGDSFNAGFIFQYLKGASLEECLRYGNAIGALSTTAPGGTGAFKDKGAISDLVKVLLHGNSK